MEKPNVLFILSLGHSGSTLLDLLLGSSSEAVSGGEIYDAARGKNARGGDDQGVCGCGSALAECPVWSKVHAACRADMDDEERYLCALRTFAVATGQTVIDSSKRLEAYRAAVALNQAGKINLSVLFLVRDVRGWVTSYVERNKKNNLPKESVLRLMFRWRKHNQQLANLITQGDVPYTTVSYEELIFDTPGTLARVSAFGGITLGDGQSFTGNHVALGNRTKHNAHDAFEVIYDARWLHNAAVSFWFGVLPFIRQANRRYISLPNYKR